MGRPVVGAHLACDANVLALGVDDQHRARAQQQVGDHRADALAGAGGGQRQQMRGTVPSVWPFDQGRDNAPATAS
jgi:hypothetical protein